MPRVRVEPGVDIYGPCSGLARCCLGGPSTSQETTSGANRSSILAVKRGEGPQMAQICPPRTNRMRIKGKDM